MVLDFASHADTENIQKHINWNPVQMKFVYCPSIHFFKNSHLETTKIYI